VRLRSTALVSIVLALLTTGGSAWALSLELPPVNLISPVVTGVPAVGQPLGCSQGVWTGPPTSYAYQWTRAGVDIAGAAFASYTVAPGDAGKLLRCRVTASNSMGSRSATSLPVLGLAVGSAPPAAGPPPGSTGPASPEIADVIRLPKATRCASRRRFRIRIRKLAGVDLVAVAVYVNGKPVKVVKGRRLTAPVDLRGLPRGTASVRIEAATRDGRRFTHTRKYRTCSKLRGAKRRHHL
jgi:hypothetical protein